MTEPPEPMNTFGSPTPDLPGGAPFAPQPARASLADYLALRQMPWGLDYVGFLAFVIAITTYIAKIGTAAMVVACIGLALGRRRAQWPLTFWLLLAFWAWAALSTALSDYPGDFNEVIDLGKVFVVFFVAINVLWHPLRLRFFLLLFITCFALFPARGTIFNYYIHEHADFGRAAWAQLFGNPNDMAALTLLALALATGFLHKEAPRVVRFGAVLACLVLPFIVLLTQSRAGFVGLGIFLLLFVLSINRNRLRVWLAVGAIAAMVVATAPKDVWQRIAGLRYAQSTDTLELVDPEGSAEQRWEIWRTGSRVIRDNRILGVGIGRYQQANLAYSPVLGARDIHNTFLEVLAETGVPGLLLFLWLLITILRRAGKTRRNTRAQRDLAEWRRLQRLEFGLYAYLAAGLWGTYGFLSMLYIYLAIVIAQTEALAALAAKPSTDPVSPGPFGARVWRGTGARVQRGAYSAEPGPEDDLRLR